MSSAASDPDTVDVPPVRRALLLVVTMTASTLVMIDQTIANVALPHMQAALGATPDTVTWVITSYILANAVGMPIAGWLSARFGRTTFFTMSIAGFTIASMLCGLAVSMPMMVAARLVQGFFGAFLVPLSQAIVFDTHPREKQLRAITIWGIGCMAGSILGPVLGGYLTDAMNWRWVFFINVPIGLVTALGSLLLMPKFNDVRRAFDHRGFAIIVVALCSLQLALDRGTQEDWLESPEILFELGLSIAAFWMLGFHLARAKNPIIPRELMRNRTFVSVVILGFVVLPAMMAGQVFVPPMVQTLFGYPTTLAGLILIPRAVALTIGMVLGNKLMAWADVRVMILLGMGLVAWSLHLHTGFSLQMGIGPLIWTGLLQGAGIGLAMTCINFITVSSAPPELRTDAVAVFNMVRNVGTSIVIAMASALLARNTQVNHAELGSAMQLGTLPSILAQGPIGGMVAAIANLEINRQSMMIAYINDFWWMMWAVVIAMPVVLFVRPPRRQAGEAMIAIE